MPKHDSQLANISGIAAETAKEMGFFLVDAELAREPEGLFLRFYIDKPGGITLNDCEAYHKRLQPDTENIEYDYMEVSSPGADRPLKKPEDFARAHGDRVEVRLYAPAFGAKRHIGTLIGMSGDEIQIRSDAGAELAFPKKSVSLVKPLIEFTEEDLQDESPAPQGEN